MVIVNIPETKTDTPRSFAITQPQWIDKLKAYSNLRKFNNQRFLLTYSNGKCINTPVGINTIGKIPMKIATFLGLEKPWEFTGHCFRRSMATSMADHGEGLIAIKQLGGWKSSSVAESYIQDSIQSKIALAKRIQSSQNPHCSKDQPLLTTVNIQDSQQVSSASASFVSHVPGVEIKDCSNCTVNVRVFNNCTFPSTSPKQ